MIVIGIRGQREAARRDLVEHFVYLADSSGLATAECFLTRAEASFNVLAGQPLIGAPLSLRHPDLAGMRKWRVKDFDNHLIFYLPRHDGVAIVRVLQAAQDWRSLLGIENQNDWTSDLALCGERSAREPGGESAAMARRLAGGRRRQAQPASMPLNTASSVMRKLTVANSIAGSSLMSSRFHRPSSPRR